MGTSSWTSFQQNTQLVIQLLERGRNAAELLVLLRYWNAASVAGLLLTTQVMIADAPKDEAEHAHMPPGGGMCNMACKRQRLPVHRSIRKAQVRKLAGAFP